MSLESDGLETCGREKDVAPRLFVISATHHPDRTNRALAEPRQGALPRRNERNAQEPEQRSRL